MAAATPRMRAIRDSDAAFRAAIDRGLISEDAANERFAGRYMYMFHDTEGAAWFKHRETRRYVTLAPETCEGVAPCKGAAPCKGTAPGNLGENGPDCGTGGRPRSDNGHEPCEVQLR